MKETPYAWVMVWATFGCLALIFGVSYSFAAFFESFAAEFSAQRADVSWIFGLSGFVYFVLGAGGGMLADRFGPRIVCSAVSRAPRPSTVSFARVIPTAPMRSRCRRIRSSC